MLIINVWVRNYVRFVKISCSIAVAIAQKFIKVTAQALRGAKCDVTSCVFLSLQTFFYGELRHRTENGFYLNYSNAESDSLNSLNNPYQWKCVLAITHLTMLAINVGGRSNTGITSSRFRGTGSEWLAIVRPPVVFVWHIPDHLFLRRVTPAMKTRQWQKVFIRNHQPTHNTTLLYSGSHENDRTEISCLHLHNLYLLFRIFGKAKWPCGVRK